MLPLMHVGLTLYWSFKCKAATHSITAAPCTLRMRHTSRSTDRPPYAATAMTPLEWRTGGRTYTARWPSTDKPASGMGGSSRFVPPAHTAMSAVQWHMSFRLLRTTATSRHSTAVATAASARSELVSALQSRQAQPGARARSVKAPATVHIFNLSCSSDTDAAVRLATADKQRTRLVGDQTAPRMLLTDCCEAVPVGDNGAVPVAGVDALEGTAAQMLESSQQVQCLLSCFVPCLGRILRFLCMPRFQFQGRFDLLLMLAHMLPGLQCFCQAELFVLLMLCACLVHSLPPHSRKLCHLVHCSLCVLSLHSC